MVKQGDKYMFLQDKASGSTYDIDHQDEEVKKFEEKKEDFSVRRTLDPNTEDDSRAMRRRRLRIFAGLYQSNIPARARISSKAIFGRFLGPLVKARPFGMTPPFAVRFKVRALF